LVELYKAQMPFLFGWAADNNARETLLHGPVEHLLPSC
jgi:hypothetical protein